MNRQRIDSQESKRILETNPRGVMTIAKSNMNKLSTNSNLNQERELRLIKPKNQKGLFNPLTISLVIIVYITLDPSITRLVTYGRNLSINSGSSVKQSQTGSLIGMVAAGPAPEPSPAAITRSASSANHRVPPMNGSIFGKRSTNNRIIGNGHKSTGRRGDLVYKITQEQSQQVHDSSSELKIQPSSEAQNYSDLITEIIEDFLANNNESDPHKTSVAFCRMIIYECNQLLATRPKPSSNRR